MEIKVGHVKRRFSYRGKNIYIGRKIYWRAAAWEQSPLANPFKIAEFPNDCQERYRQWLWKKIKSNDQHVMDELYRIIDIAQQTEVTLLCWCVGTRHENICHGHVVKAACKWLMSQ